MKGKTMAWPLLVIAALLVTVSLLPGSCADQILPVEEKTMEEAREAMVRLLIAYGVRDEKVIAAMRKVKRHNFLPAGYFSRDAYGDHPLPIGHDQTISQPYIVAYMTERIAPRPGEKVLEIGTGSGYQAAVLAELGADVYSIEIVPELASHSIEALAREGYKCTVKCGDGYQGWPEHAPFSMIIVTCAPEELPEKLVEQLADGGRMILPLGAYSQRLVILRKKGERFITEDDLPVRFVPMIKGTK
ncbi:MAG: Protein-L-isoaspartate O-methyltransferase [Candidatus Rifleibacterium amylolyticum]|nr:MAG: Protein-L-isoaspartate O-methyltransferase [Candidatus Rifleibacterium amylolyticum]NLF96388.1 protein-L-isoaspartate(D-aspartate) O-methyltransferase [Candidatus Riflebacteria bacterium]